MRYMFRAYICRRQWTPDARVASTWRVIRVRQTCLRQIKALGTYLRLQPPPSLLHANAMRRFLLCLLLCLTTFTQNAFAAILAIDYGSEWIKASLMSPGVPFDVLLDRNSKRKIQSTVGWKKEDRLFGSDAFNIVNVPLTFRSVHLTKCRQGGSLQTPSPI